MAFASLTVAVLLATARSGGGGGGGSSASSTDAADAMTAAAPLEPFASLSILYKDDVLSAAAAVIARHVKARSNCTVGTAGALRLTLFIDDALGSEAYTASFDGASNATIVGGDR